MDGIEYGDEVMRMDGQEEDGQLVDKENLPPPRFSPHSRTNRWREGSCLCFFSSFQHLLLPPQQQQQYLSFLLYGLKPKCHLL